MIDKFMITGWLGDISNPVLEHHYSVVQALALEQKQPDEAPLTLKPIPRMMSEEGDAVIRDFVSAVEAVTGGSAQSKLAVEAEKKAARADAKRKKDQAPIESAVAALAKGEPYDFKTWWKQEALDYVPKLTVDELKAYLKNFKISSTGKKKAELLEAVTDHIKKNMG